MTSQASLKRQEFLAILQKGIQAPSADNLQPWQFRLGENTVELRLDSQYIEGFADTAYLMPYLSAGAVIENARVAAVHFGYTIQPHYFPVPEDKKLVARLHFMENTAREDHPHFEMIGKRTTNRKFYDPRLEIGDAIYSRIESAAAEEDGFQLHWIKRGERRYERLKSLIGDSDQIRFEARRLHEEFIQILRLDTNHALRSRDGIDVRSLESGPGSGAMFRMISSWRNLQFMNALGLSRLFNLYARLQMGSAQAAGMLAAWSQEPVAYVRGGEVLQKIWHEMTALGISMQPMEGLPIFILNEQQNGCTDLPLKNRGKIARMKREFFSLFDLNDRNGLIMLFRAGYADPPTVRTLRRPVESFLV